MIYYFTKLQTLCARFFCWIDAFSWRQSTTVRLRYIRGLHGYLSEGWLFFWWEWSDVSGSCERWIFSFKFDEFLWSRMPWKRRWGHRCLKVRRKSHFIWFFGSCRRIHLDLETRRWGPTHRKGYWDIFCCQFQRKDHFSRSWYRNFSFLMFFLIILLNHYNMGGNWWEFVGYL